MARLRLLIPALALLSTLAVPAQTRAELKKELRDRTKNAKTADAMFEVGQWANENGLARDAKKLFEKVLTMQSEHPGAMDALGFEKWDGEWMKRKDAQKAREAALDAEYKAKGMIKVEGVWVGKDEVDDAKRGIYHHDDELISRDEKMAFLEGKVRHPRTGMFIAPEDLPKAEQGLFPVGGKWVGEEEADKHHNNLEHPWVLRTHYAVLVTNLPIKTFDKNGDNSLRGLIDGAIDQVKPVFGGEVPHPKFRPLIGVCQTTDDYRAIGNQIGSEDSAYGAFFTDEALPVENQRHYTNRRAVFANFGDKNWGPYYVRHAAGYAVARSFADQVETEIPLWFTRGCGALPERHGTAANAAWFGKQHLSKGGVKDLGAWIEKFEISPNLQPRDLDYNIYQAGLVLSFAMRGGDKKTTDAMMKITAALSKGKGAEKAFAQLQKVLASRENELRAYFQKVLQK